MKLVSSAQNAVENIQLKSRIFIHGAAATPNELIKALVSHAQSLAPSSEDHHHSLELIHLHTEGPALYARPEHARHFRVSNLFVGHNMRDSVGSDFNDYLPCFLSEMPTLFRKGVRRPQVALIQVSPPDRHGFCTLGTSVDAAKAAAECAELVIAQINHQMPRIHGDGFIHIDDIDFAFECDEPLPSPKPARLSAEELAIGRNVASLIEDGSTLQMGIGAVPDAVLASLKGHKNLGIHTEMWSSGALELIRSGAIDNSQKKVHPGKTVATFLTGSEEVYKFVHDNPSVVLLEADYVNNTAVIRRNPKVVAINSAVEVDLTGQICADSIGSRIISGVGGQMDFIRGASLSEGGKPIIALTSRTARGVSRIVSQLRAGAGVVTTRAHVHFVVTEHGIADLYGRTLGERARALIAIAHPEDRERLEREWLQLQKTT